MAIQLDDYMAGLPKKRQHAIKKRSGRTDCRGSDAASGAGSREQSQEEVAKQLHIKQAAVSKLRRRTDMYLSTLRGFIEAMGGKLEIVARFPTRPCELLSSSCLTLSSAHRD